MKIIFRILFVAFSVAFLAYLSFPGPAFPSTLSDIKVSEEPADKESPLRQGYYTNLSRDQIMAHYTSEFGWGLRLNYPHEEAQVLIRDQTQSSYLEEIVHPLRESLFVDGYNYQHGKETPGINGVVYRTKVIVKYVPSLLPLRLAIGIGIIAAFWVLFSEWANALYSLKWTSR